MTSEAGIEAGKVAIEEAVDGEAAAIGLRTTGLKWYGGGAGYDDRGQGSAAEVILEAVVGRAICRIGFSLEEVADAGVTGASFLRTRLRLRLEDVLPSARAPGRRPRAGPPPR